MMMFTIFTTLIIMIWFGLFSPKSLLKTEHKIQNEKNGLKGTNSFEIAL